MKVILSILILFLSVTTYGQRYRLVADTTFKYTGTTVQQNYEPTAVRKYIYCKENELPCSKDLANVPFDTLFSYRLQNDVLVLSSRQEKCYSKEGNVLLRKVYMLSQNQLVPERLDSFVYNKDGLLAAKFLYVYMDCAGGDGKPITYCSIPMQRIVYEYEQGLCVSEKRYAMDDVRKGQLMYVARFKYNERGKVVSQENKVYGSSGDTTTITFTYRYDGKDRLVSVHKIDTTPAQWSEVNANYTYSDNKLSGVISALVYSVNKYGVINKDIDTKNYYEELTTDSTIIITGVNKLEAHIPLVNERIVKRLGDNGYLKTILQELPLANDAGYQPTNKHTYTYEAY